MTDKQRNTAMETALFLGRMADTLDTWAKESREGGWSTHQVQANIGAASDCRSHGMKLMQACLE